MYHAYIDTHMRILHTDSTYTSTLCGAGRRRVDRRPGRRAVSLCNSVGDLWRRGRPDVGLHSRTFSGAHRRPNVITGTRNLRILLESPTMVAELRMLSHGAGAGACGRTAARGLQRSAQHLRRAGCSAPKPWRLSRVATSSTGGDTGRENAHRRRQRVFSLRFAQRPELYLRATGIARRSRCGQGSSSWRRPGACA